MSAVLNSGEIGIEIAGPNNQKVMFNPTQTVLRGRWSYRQLPRGARYDEPWLDLNHFDEIPGLYVIIDVVGGAARIIDPLALPEYKQLRDDIAKCLKEHPAPDQAYDLDGNAVATWVHWMQELIKYGHAVLLPGSAEWPTRLPGRVMLDPHNAGQNPLRYKDEFDAERERGSRHFATASAGAGKSVESDVE